MVIRSGRIVTDEGVVPGEVHIRDGTIEHVVTDRPATGNGTPGTALLDVGELVVMAGLVDTHVHVNEPGRTDWEGFETAGLAAAAGGVTTIVVMPLNCTPAATSVGALVGEVEAAREKCRVDYGLWGGVVPGNTGEIGPMWEAGALGFKAFMVESGVEDFGGVSVAALEKAADVLSRLGAPLLVHAEDPGVITRAAGTSGLAGQPRSYRRYLASRPPEAEQEAVAALMRNIAPRGVHVHVVHVADGTGVPRMIREAQSRGLNVTAETCPHYLAFCAEEIDDGATGFKCAPPIRDRESREALWGLLRDGPLSMVVSDHSPCPPGMKSLEDGDFAKAWGGISSLQLGLAATWTGACRRGFGLADIARWMCENPARLAGLAGRKGRIAPGCDADLVIFEPETEWTVRGAELYHRHKATPYDGRTLRGVVNRTILRGRIIYDASSTNPFPTEPTGRWIKREST